MKREIKFVQERGVLAVALGCDRARTDEIESHVARLMEDGASLRKVIESINDRDDLTDAEWAVFLYTIGYYQGQRA